MVTNRLDRVKLPKSFVAVNLSDAFTFEEHENTENESDSEPTTAETTEEQGDAREAQDIQSPEKEQAEKPGDAGETA